MNNSIWERIMWLDERAEELFIRFLSPLEIPLPTEVHELSRLLLNAYNAQARKAGGDISFYQFISEILQKYYPYIEKLIVENKVSITEHTNILKWWKQIIAVPSIQGLLVNTQYSLAAPVLKLCLVTGYLVKSKWNKRSIRKLVNKLDEEIKNRKSLKEFSQRIPEYEKDMLEESVSSSDDEVDELAVILIDARKKIYWNVKSRMQYSDY